MTKLDNASTVNGNLDISALNLTTYLPSTVFVRLDLTKSQVNFTNSSRKADFVGVKMPGTIEISGAPRNSAPTASQKPLTWIEGDAIKITGNTTFSNDTSLVASGDLTKVANATNIGGVKTPDVYAGIYVANGASLSTSTGKNLTLMQNGSYKAAADANAYGVYVANGGTIGNSTNSANLTLQQNGAITASGTGIASAVYVAGTIAQGGNVVIDQIGKISAEKNENAIGVKLISGGTLSAGANNLSINSGNKDIVLDGDITTKNLSVNAGGNLKIGSALTMAGDFNARAGGDYEIKNSVNAANVTVNTGGSLKINSDAKVTTDKFTARTWTDFAQYGTIIGKSLNGASVIKPTISIETSRDLTLASDVDAASLTLTAGRALKVNNNVTVDKFTAISTYGDITTKAKITSGSLFSATANKGNVTLDGQVIAATFTASAGGNITAINSDNQITTLGNLSGNTVKIYTFQTDPSNGAAPNVVKLNGNFQANNLSIVSSKNATNGTMYNLVGSSMTLASQDGKSSPNSWSFSGNDTSGSGKFTIPSVKIGARTKTLDAEGLYFVLNSTVTR